MTRESGEMKRSLSVDRRYWLVGLILVAGFFISYELYNFSRATDFAEANHTFEERATDRLRSVEHAITNEQEVIRSLVGFFNASQHVGRKEFELFLRSVLNRFPAIQAIEWIPRVAASERPAFEAAGREDGFQNFQITERSGDGKVIPAGPRREYFPVYFVEPYQGNEAALGFDLGSHPARRTTLEKARDIGNFTVSEKIALIQGGAGILIFAPIYGVDQPRETVLQRRQHLRGFALGVIDIEKVVESTYEKRRSLRSAAGIDIYLYDDNAAEGQQLLYFHSSRARADTKRTVLTKAEVGVGPRVTNSFSIGDRTWTLVAKPVRPNFGVGVSWGTWSAALPSALLTLVLAAFVYSTISRSLRLENEVAERKEIESSLMESEERFRNIINNSPAFISLKDAQGRYKLVNQVYAELFGFEQQDIVGKSISELFDNKTSENSTKHDQKVIETKGVLIEERPIISNKGTIDFLVTKFPILDQTGAVREIGTIGVDITERKKAEKALTKSQTFLMEALESIYEGFVLYGPDGRLVVCNSRYKDFFGYSDEEATPGVHTLDLGRLDIERGTVILAEDETEEYMNRRETSARELAKTFVIRLRDGRTLLTRDNITSSGSIVSIQTDITSLKNAEEALKESEQRLSEAQRIASLGNWDWNIVGNELWWSDEIYRIFGLEPQQFGATYEAFLDAIHPEDRQDVIDAVDSALNERTPYNIGHRIVLADGTEKVVHEFGEVTFDAAGTPIRMIGTVQDITVRKQAEEAALEAQARLAGILDIAPEAVIAIGENMNISLFNQGAERIFGYSAEEVLGKPLDMLMPERSRNGHAKHVRTFDASDDDHHLMNERMEIAGLRKSGSEFPASASVSKLVVNGQKIFTVLLQDITQRKRAEDAILSSKTEAEYANYAKSQFLANMSHELRTPLNSIIGFSQILMGQGMGELDFAKSSDYATNINDSANHLLAVIQDILDVSKIEAGELDLDKEVVDFEKLIQDCITMVKERAANEGVKLSYKIAESVPSIKADEVRLKQILLNLLSNAIKFTPDGGKVEIALEASDDAVILRVDDTGIGIEKNDIPKILRPFGQVKDIMRRNHEGTGLGLSLAKSLVELHGGNLAIASELGKGTTVIVQLPNGAP